MPGVQGAAGGALRSGVLFASVKRCACQDERSWQLSSNKRAQMFCSECGARALTPSAKFCSHCGAALLVESSGGLRHRAGAGKYEELPSVASDASTSGARDGRSKPGSTWGILDYMAVALVCGCSCFAFLNRRTS